MNRDQIIRLDKSRVWHPYTAMDDYIERVDPIVVREAHGVWLHDTDGRSYIDANSSWWVAGLGHGHPRLVRVLREQAESLVHCSLAGIAHEPAARLADELCAVTPPGFTRAFFTDNGSTSIEVAVKMATQMWQQLGAPKKTRFVALEGAFHGDTLAPTSLGGVQFFRRPFANILFDCVHVPSPADADFQSAFEKIESVLNASSDSIAAVVVEPIVQGAAGMRIYRAEYLKRLSEICRRRDVLLIVDEVFTGYGRTGPMWACDHAAITPDILCLGKAFASLLPMGATLVTDRVFDAFRGGKDRALMYGHTFCGHPLGAALAREVLAIYRDENVIEQCKPKAERIARAFAKLEHLSGVSSTRSIGMIAAADLEPRQGGNTGYLGSAGWRVYEEARARGAYMRPLGDTIYICPPLVINDAELDELLTIVNESVEAALR